MMMKRLVRVVGHNGVTYEVPMTAEQAAFFLRMAEYKANSIPGITFNDVVAEWREKQLSCQYSQKSE
jgi:hypothetical protein